MAFPLALVGSNRAIGSDTIMFGGQDTASGNFLNEVWILRSYMGALSSNSSKWSGFGNGILSSGPDASGTGVDIAYLVSCVSPNLTSSGSSSSVDVPNPTSSSLKRICSRKPLELV